MGHVEFSLCSFTLYQRFLSQPPRRSSWRRFYLNGGAFFGLMPRGARAMWEEWQI